MNKRKLIVLEDLGMSYPKSTYKKKVHFVLAECPICKNGFKTRESTVKNGSTSKCKPCASRLRMTTHNKTKTPLYKKWVSMKNRCYNKNSQDYKYYGAMGIKVCDEWLNDFENFETWALRNEYETELSIDRKKSDGNYEPCNCRFISLSKNISRAMSRNNSDRRSWIKIDIDKASELCEAYQTGLFTQDKIATHFKVSQSTISNIVRGEL